MEPSTSIPDLLGLGVVLSPDGYKDFRRARRLFKNDETMDPQVRDHILNVILVESAVPDPGRVARIIIDYYESSDNDEYYYDLGPKNENDGTGKAFAERSNQCFPEVFLAGMSYLLNYKDEYTISLQKGEIYEPPNLAARSPSRFGPNCEITGNHGPAANLQYVHILPPYISTAERWEPGRYRFWDLLCFFWDSEVIGRAKAACARPDNKSHPRSFTNAILMSSSCRKSFEALEFSLLPVLDTYTPNKYDVEFQWVHRPHQAQQRQHDFRRPPKITDDFDVVYQTLKNGDIITFETSDPVKYPLPDVGLLWIRSLLTKFALPMDFYVRENMVLNDDFDDYADDDTESQDGDHRNVFAVKDWISELVPPT